MTQRWQRAPFNEANRRSVGPLFIARPGKFGAPAKPACDRHQPTLQSATQSSFGTNSTRQDDFSSRSHDANELVERLFWVRNGGDHVLRHDNVERSVRKGEL